MRWTPGASRENVEDRRGQRGGRGGFGLPIGRLGIGGFLLLLVVWLVVDHKSQCRVAVKSCSNCSISSGVSGRR